MHSEQLNTYLSHLHQWLNYFGFSPLGTESNWLFDYGYTRDRVEATKFSKVNAYCFLKYQKDPVTPQMFEQFSRESFKYAYNIRQGNPLGIFGMLVVYPCLIVEKASPEQLGFLGKYCNKHYSAFEFTCLVELQTGEFHCYPRTPMWGALYYDGFRKEGKKLFSPKAWTEISNANKN